MTKESPKKSKMRTIKGKTFRNMYGPDKEKLVFPSLSLDLEYLPEARNWKNGNTYEVTLRLKQTSIHEDERSGSVGFDIVGVSVPDSKPVAKGSTESSKVTRRYQEEDDRDSD